MSVIHGRTYASRAWFLKKLGFSSYQDYLNSDLWRQVRERVFLTKGRSCWLCGRHADQVHHTRYHAVDLTGKRTKHVHPICGKCHKEIEFTLDGAKATVGQAKKEFKKRRRVRREIEYLVSLFDY